MSRLFKAIKRLIKVITENDEFSKYIISENFVKFIYPKYKFSEYGRLFLEDKDFLNNFYTRFCGNNFHSMDRKFFLKELMKLVTNINGDTAECGVYEGASSFIICRANEDSILKKRHYLFDSFEGISRPTDFDGKYWTEGDLIASEEIAKENLKEFPFCVYCKGWIPSKFDLANNNTFSFVHLDVDLYQPTLDSLVFFYERLVAGGILVCDDYGFTSCPGAKKAMDEFFHDKPEDIVHVPTGQGFVIKAKV